MDKPDITFAAIAKANRRANKQLSKDFDDPRYQAMKLRMERSREAAAREKDETSDDWERVVCAPAEPVFHTDARANFIRRRINGHWHTQCHCGRWKAETARACGSCAATARAQLARVRSKNKEKMRDDSQSGE